MFRSSRWHPSRLVSASIAIGLAILGAVLVWAALAMPSTPDAALDRAPNDDSVPSTSPNAPQPTHERPTAGADQDLRDQITGLVLPESEPVAVSIPKIGVRSRLVDLGLNDGEMEVPASCRGWLVHWGAYTRCTRAGRHHWPRDLERRSLWSFTA